MAMIKLIEGAQVDLPSGRTLDDVMVGRIKKAFEASRSQAKDGVTLQFNMSPTGKLATWPGEVTLAPEEFELERFSHSVSTEGLEKIMDAVEAKQAQMQAQGPEEKPKDPEARRKFGNQELAPKEVNTFIEGRGPPSKPETRRKR